MRAKPAHARCLFKRFEIEKPRSNANDVFQLYEDSPTASFEAPALFEDSLCGWASTLIELGHSLLTDTVLKNRHGAPFVQVLLLALHFNSQIVRAEPDTGASISPAAVSLHSMCSTILPLDTDANIAAARDRYSFLAKHEFGSRVLEVLLQCTPDSHFAKVSPRPAALLSNLLANPSVRRCLPIKLINYNCCTFAGPPARRTGYRCGAGSPPACQFRGSKVHEMCARARSGSPRRCRICSEACHAA